MRKPANPRVFFVLAILGCVATWLGAAVGVAVAFHARDWATVAEGAVDAVIFGVFAVGETLELYSRWRRRKTAYP